MKLKVWKGAPMVEEKLFLAVKEVANDVISLIIVNETGEVKGTILELFPSGSIVFVSNISSCLAERAGLQLDRNGRVVIYNIKDLAKAQIHPCEVTFTP